MFSKFKKIYMQVLQNHFVKDALKKAGFGNYDLPLNHSEDTRFIIMLVGLMSFLAVLSCSGMFALNNMTNRWSTGLENKVTIEIAVETKEGNLISNSTIKSETKKLADKLAKNPIIKSLDVLSNDDIQELISPWIGKNLILDDIPLPGIIAIELYNSSNKNIEMLEKDINDISKYGHLETHREWLSDLILFASILKILSIFITLIIGGATIITITAAIRTRLVIHCKEVELLHHMGATDNYISNQFQRHAMILSLKGSAIGAFMGLIITGIIILLSRYSGSPLIPVIEIGYTALLFLFAIPAIVALIAVITSRFTVLQNLSKMP